MQFWEDWSGSTLNAEPAGWTKLFVTSGTLYRVEEDTSGHAPAGRRLLIDKSATDRAAIKFDAVGTSEADVQVRLLVRSVGGKSAQYGGPSGRLSGAAGSESTIYGAFTTTGRIANVQLNDGASSVLGYGASSNVYTSSDYYWLTLTLAGETATTTLAAVGSPETIIDTASQSAALTGAGGVGIFASWSSTILHVLAVGVGTDGDPAPYSAPAGDTEPPGLTGFVTFASVTQTSYTAQWPAGLDNVAVTGYEYQIGSTAGAWTDAGNSLFAAITGRTAGTTETVYVRAYDAAGLRSTPAISGEVTLQAEPVVKGIALALYDDAAPQASISGIRALWWDATEPTGAPVLETPAATTDASGVLTLDLSAVTSLSLGSGGFLLLYKLDLADHRDSLQFAGRVIIEDIG